MERDEGEEVEEPKDVPQMDEEEGRRQRSQRREMTSGLDEEGQPPWAHRRRQPESHQHPWAQRERASVCAWPSCCSTTSHTRQSPRPQSTAPGWGPVRWVRVRRATRNRCPTR